MSRHIEGKFLTRFGPCRFRMDNGKQAIIILGTEDVPFLTVHRVEYRGQSAVKRNDGNSPWEHDHDNSYIRRVDNKNIEYDKLRELLDGLIADFAQHVHACPNIILAAAWCNQESLRGSYVNVVSDLEKRLNEAKRALEEFDSSIQAIALQGYRMAMEKLPPRYCEAHGFKVVL
jgi:hypothetical protein